MKITKRTIDRARQGLKRITDNVDDMKQNRKEELEQEYERPPSAEELAEALEVPEDKINDSEILFFSCSILLWEYLIFLFSNLSTL